ncbi:hypothetical protein COCNU_scaffold002876G000010 [Cocos nucifera]|nr:hypothetical protein [Cocos nucifera]
MEPTSGMETDAVERLTKGLYAQKKRKGKASSEGSKWVKVSASDPMAPVAADVTSEVYPRPEVALATSIDVVKGGSLPPEPVGLPVGYNASNPSANKEKEKGKGRSTVAKVARKAHLDKPSNSDSNDLGADPFSNLNIIQDLTDKFAMPEVADCMADLDQMQFVWDFLETFLKLSK